MKADFSERVAGACDTIRRVRDYAPELALVTGTGLGPLLSEIDVVARLPYAEIEGFPVSTAPGHAGELLLGDLRGRRVVAQNGRFHLYEGWSADDIVLPVYVMAALGARRASRLSAASSWPASSSATPHSCQINGCSASLARASAAAAR